MTTPPSEAPLNLSKKRNFWLLVVAMLFLLAGLAWLLYWIIVGRFYVYTDDAYVHGNEVMLTPQVSASVTAIYADETNLVHKGQLIVELDRSDFELQFEEFKKRLEATVREVASLFQDAEAKEAKIGLKAAELRQAELDLKHRDPLVKTGAVSLEEYETFQTNVVVAAAAHLFAQKEFDAAKALIVGTTIETHPRVQEAVWNLRQTYLNLIRCQIWAPATGYVAKRSVQVGDRVSTGDTLLYIVPLDYIWIEANYKETQLKNVRIGQEVAFTADLYGGNFTYHGHVIGFQPGSGNAFSLLPPENAAGNWIKIIQRVPVRISVLPEDLIQHPLLLGLSMRVTVNVHDTSGRMLAPVPIAVDPIYSTTIYKEQIKEMFALDPLICELIKHNSEKN